jgi:hypothetical protein
LSNHLKIFILGYSKPHSAEKYSVGGTPKGQKKKLAEKEFFFWNLAEFRASDPPIAHFCSLALDSANFIFFSQEK